MGPAPRARSSSCISQFGNGAYLAAEYIGGQSVNRDFKGTDKARDPITPDRRRPAARGAQAPGRPDPRATRRSSSRPRLLRKLITESWQDSRYSSFGGLDYPIYRMILNIQEIVLDQCLDSERAPADPEPGDAERPRQRSAQDRRGLPLAQRWHLHRAGRAGRRAPRRSRSRPSAATSSASTSSGSAPWSWAPRTIRRWAATGFIIFLGGQSLGPARRQEPGPAAPRGDRPEDRQARRPARTSRSTTPPWPTSRRSASGSTRS